MVVLALGCTSNTALAGAVRAGFNATSHVATDDAPVPSAVSIGFTANLFWLSFSQIFINNNGNVTLGSSSTTFTPSGLAGSTKKIFAPFFGDVDTTGAGSGVVTYGTGTVDGFSAFGVNWVNVGYYDAKTDKKNSFQLIFIDRSDTGAGNFDFEFNYDQIQWETGDASGGSNGLGGTSGTVGYTKGTDEPRTVFEFIGSRKPGSFLDANATTGLIKGSAGSAVLGRYVFQARSGSVQNYGGTTVATVPTVATGSGINGETLVATFNGSITAAAVETLIENLTYQNTSDSPTASRTISVIVQDGGASTSTAQTVTITVNAENDAPQLSASITSPADITAAGDTISALGGSSPSSEQVANAIDNSSATKYLNFGKLRSVGQRGFGLCREWHGRHGGRRDYGDRCGHGQPDRRHREHHLGLDGGRQLEHHDAERHQRQLQFRPRRAHSDGHSHGGTVSNGLALDHVQFHERQPGRHVQFAHDYSGLE